MMSDEVRESEIIRVRVNGDTDNRMFPRWTQVSEILGEKNAKGMPYIAAMVNNEVVSLGSGVGINGQLQGLTAANSYGWKVLQRSYAFLLAMAVHRTYPKNAFRVQHSVGPGLFCTLDVPLEHSTFPESVTEQLEREMTALVERDVPIRIVDAGYMEVIQHFEQSGQEDKLNLLRHHNVPMLTLLRCGDFCDLAQGPVVHRTGVLSRFKLIPYESGFVLHIPDRGNPLAIPEFQPQPHLIKVYQDHAEWGKILGIQTAGQLNEAIHDKTISDVIQMSEGRHDRDLANIAVTIASRRPAVKLVLMAGPSSAGKTTSAKRLVTHLRINGMRPLLLGTDDYFRTQDTYPLDEEGKPDFEHIEAVDLEALNHDLNALMNGESIKKRTFSFKTKQPTYSGEELRLGDAGVIVIEGLHGLNPRLTEKILRNRKFLIYLSALTQLGVDNNNRISTTDNRLLRRIVRDSQFRSHTARKTLQMWPSVRRGEERWVFPFQQLADATFNSSLDYELGVLKTFVDPLLTEIKPDVPEYADARRLHGFMRNFYSIPADQVPNDSLLREFIGGSLLEY